MNRYFLIRRLRGPAVLVLIGVLALLDQMGAIHHFWGWFWPLLMIMMGALLLAERAALATDGDPGDAPYPGYPGYTGPGYPAGPYAAAGDPSGGQRPGDPGAAIVPAKPQDFGGGSSGGQS
jgi:hypothetical protein